MAQPDPRIVRTIDAFAEQRQRQVDRITDMVAALFAGFDGWYSDSLVAEVTDQVAARVSAGQLGIAALTDAYLARVTSAVFGRAVSAAGVPASMGRTLRTGPASTQDVYKRVAAEYRWQRFLGQPDAAASDIAVQRSKAMAATDLDLAHQRQVQRFNQTRGVTRYRRVIRSERTCGLCAAASDRLYYRDDLLPIHARCRCDVIAVTAQSDPGSLLNEQTFQDLYQAAGSTYGKDLKRVTVEVVQHGELGPQLRVAGQNFRGPDDLPAAA